MTAPVVNIQLGNDQLSLDELEAIFPGRSASRKAAVEAITPPTPFAGVETKLTGSEQERVSQRGEELNQFLAAQQGKKESRARGATLGKEEAVTAAVLIGSTVLAPFAGPIIGGGSLLAKAAATALTLGPKATKVAGVVGGVTASAGAQGTLAFNTELLTRLIAGEDLEEALPKAGATGAFFAGADVAGPVVAKTVGKIYGGVRGAMRFGRSKMRSVRGKEPLPQGKRITSTVAPFVDMLEPETRDVIRTLKEVGGTPRPGQFVQHELITATENILETSLTSARGRGEIKRENIELLFAGIRDIVNILPRLGRQKVGELLQSITTGRLSRIKGIAQGHYRTGDKLAGGKMKTVSQEIVEEVPVLGANGEAIVSSSGTPLTRTVSRTVEHQVPEFGGDLLETQKLAVKLLKQLKGGLGNNPRMERQLQGLIDRPRTATIADMQQMRSELFEQSQQFVVGAGDVVKADKGMAKALTIPLTRAMNSAINKAPAEAKAAYQAGRKLWKEEIRGELTSAYISKLANNQADDVLDAIIANGSPAEIKMIRDIVMKEDPKAWEAIQGAYISRMFWKHGERRVFGGTENIVSVNGKALVDDITKQAGFDGEVLRALFPGDFSRGGRVLANFKRYAQTIASETRGLPPGSPGAIWIQLGQAGAVGGVIGGTTLYISGNLPAGSAAFTVGSAAAFLFTPNMIGRMFKNPEIINWLITGAKHSPGTVPAIRASIAILGLLIKNSIFSDEDSERAVNLIQSKTEELEALKRGGRQ